MSNSELCRCLMEQKVGIGYNADKLINARCEQNERDDEICGACGECPDDCRCVDADPADEKKDIVIGYNSCASHVTDAQNN